MALVVLMLAGIVHLAMTGAAAQTAKALPPLVAEMRERILAAVESGRIEDLAEPLAWNELPPMYSPTADGDPIGYWKAMSAEGDGRDVLEQIGRVLALPPARVAIGRDAENSAVFVWPYLSERPLGQLSPSEVADLGTLMPAAAADAMRTAGRWTWWRLVIGADGTWHALTKGEAETPAKTNAAPGALPAAPARTPAAR